MKWPQRYTFHTRLIDLFDKAFLYSPDPNKRKHNPEELMSKTFCVSPKWNEYLSAIS